MNSGSVQKRMAEVMGKNANAFTSSVINLVNSSQQLQDVDAMSVVSSAMVAAALNLPVDPNLGYMYIVPFREKDKASGSWLKRAQPQMGYRGYIQLALRTGQYKAINASVVHEGEIRDWDPFSETYSVGEKISDKVVGYVGHFELLNGFQKTTYWTVEEMDEHRKQYSKSGNYNGQRSGVWKSNFDAMAIKTVIRNLLSKWGILSIQMQEAVAKDETPQNFDPETGELTSEPKWVDGAEEESTTDTATTIDPDLAKEADEYFKSQTDSAADEG
jgi:recombination protein RecT